MAGLLLKLLTVVGALAVFMLAGCPTYVDVTPPDVDRKENPVAVQAESLEGVPHEPVVSPQSSSVREDVKDGDENPISSIPNESQPQPPNINPPMQVKSEDNIILSDGVVTATETVDEAVGPVESMVQPSEPSVTRDNSLRVTMDGNSTGLLSNTLRTAGEDALPTVLDPIAAAPMPESGKDPETSGDDSKQDAAIKLPGAGVPEHEPRAFPAIPLIPAIPIASPVQPTKDRHTRGEVTQDKIDEMRRRNGPIFVDWPVPKFTLLFSGELDGYIEPCGCAGLDNMKGGLTRRHSLIRQLDANGWSVVPLDLGGQIKRFGPQAEIKFRHIIEAFITLGYKAVGMGPRDLRLDVLSLAAELDSKTPFVSANVALLDFDSGFTHRFQVIDVNGKRIGVTSILGDEYLAGLKNSDVIQTTDASAALAEVIPEMQTAGCEVFILLSHADPRQSLAMAKRFPVFDFVVTAGGADEPPSKPTVIQGTKTKLIEVGRKGMYVTVVGVFDDRQTPIRYQRVPLDARFKNSPDMHTMMENYQKDLKALGLEGLEVKQIPRGDGNRFVGSEACADCHSEAWEVFENTPHAHAFQTLVDLKPARPFDPECISCHVVGWEPSKFFPYVSGYLNRDKTPKLLNVGCENCHGPGANHVAAEESKEQVPADKLERLRAALKMEIVENEGNKTSKGQNSNGVTVRTCLMCHDIDNSPDFDFQKYWPETEHHGKE